MSALKRISTQFQGTLSKQEVYLTDCSGGIKLVLWETNVEALKLDTTCILKNLKVKESKQMRYLNSSKDIEFEYSETTPFKEPLGDRSKVENQTKNGLFFHCYLFGYLHKVQLCWVYYYIIQN